MPTPFPCQPGETAVRCQYTLWSGAMLDDEEADQVLIDLGLEDRLSRRAEAVRTQVA